MALTILALRGIPEVRAGDDLAALLLDALRRNAIELLDGDVIAVSSKVASKSLGLVSSAEDKMSVVAGQTVRVVAERATGDGITRVVESSAGPVLAAAGVDGSNTGGSPTLLTLPHDPDEVCRALHAALARASGVRRLGVVLTDTAGRPWRAGQTDFALGAHGLVVLEDLRGRSDADGRKLHVTARAIADEIAAAADLVKGKDEAVPAVVVRGLPHHLLEPHEETGARRLIRTGPGDWFALGDQEAVRSALGVAPGTDLAVEVGLRPTAGDDGAAQRDRAVRVALATGLEGSIDVGEDLLVVRGERPVVTGMLAARLSLALAGEGIDHVVEVGDPARVILT